MIGIDPFDIVSGKVVDNHQGIFWFKAAGHNVYASGLPILKNLHREVYPAAMWKGTGGVYGTSYYVDGKLHREDGPAQCGFQGIYYLRGVCYNKVDYDREIAKHRPI